MQHIYVRTANKHCLINFLVWLKGFSSLLRARLLPVEDVGGRTAAQSPAGRAGPRRPLQPVRLSRPPPGNRLHSASICQSGNIPISPQCSMSDQCLSCLVGRVSGGRLAPAWAAGTARWRGGWRSAWRARTGPARFCRWTSPSWWTTRQDCHDGVNRERLSSNQFRMPENLCCVSGRERDEVQRLDDGFLLPSRAGGVAGRPGHLDRVRHLRRHQPGDLPRPVRHLCLLPNGGGSLQLQRSSPAGKLSHTETMNLQNYCKCKMLNDNIPSEFCS